MSAQRVFGHANVTSKVAILNVDDFESDGRREFLHRLLHKELAVVTADSDGATVTISPIMNRRWERFGVADQRGVVAHGCHFQLVRDPDHRRKLDFERDALALGRWDAVGRDTVIRADVHATRARDGQRVAFDGHH